MIGLVLITTILGATPGGAIAQADTALRRPSAVTPTRALVVAPLFTARDLWMALAFTGATAAALPVDQLVAHNLQLPANQNEPGLRREATAFRDLADPGTLYISTGMYALGVLARQGDLATVGLHTTEALVIASAAGFLIKGAAGRPLPRQHNADADSFVFGRGIRTDGNWQAFPSGHTLAAFAVASAVTAEASDRWPSHATLLGVLMYGTATAAGVSRLYNNAHWVSDIIFGAGIGIFSGLKTVQYARTHPDNWLDRLLLHASVAPTGRGSTAVALRFITP